LTDFLAAGLVGQSTKTCHARLDSTHFTGFLPLDVDDIFLV
jgi:hypothetical protein